MIIALCGPPGSGKTTLSQQLASEYNAKLYHYDEFKKGSKPQNTKETHQRLYNQIKQDILQGNNVILDDLHTRLEWREPLLSTLKDIPCKKILIVMTTPLEECVRRNAERQGQARLSDFVIYHLNSRYQPPSLEEGWDDIQYI